MMGIAEKIFWRALLHDWSKLMCQDEFFGFAEITHKLKDSTYGSEEYKKNLASVQKTIQYHYARQPHHPEHFKNGVNEMTLVDVIELLCDWRSSVKRHADGCIWRSITINKDRFKMGEILPNILRNSVKGKKVN